MLSNTTPLFVVSFLFGQDVFYGKLLRTCMCGYSSCSLPIVCMIACFFFSPTHIALVYMTLLVAACFGVCVLWAACILIIQRPVVC